MLAKSINMTKQNAEKLEVLDKYSIMVFKNLQKRKNYFVSVKKGVMHISW